MGLAMTSFLPVYNVTGLQIPLLFVSRDFVVDRDTSLALRWIPPERNRDCALNTGPAKNDGIFDGNDGKRCLS